MTSSGTPKIRCTAAQKSALIDYMWSHRKLARFEYDPYTAEVEWNRLAESLNRSGTVKPVDKWKVTWRDIKRKYLKEVQIAEENNRRPKEDALRVRDILTEPEEGVSKGERGGSRQYSPSSLNVTVQSTPKNSYQEQEWSETDQSQDIEYLEPIAQDQDSPASELESIEDAAEFDSSPCTSPTPMSNTRCNQDQIDALVDCMVLNPGLAFRNQHTPKKVSDWKRLRHFLNKMGPAKRTTAWIKTWRDLKRSALEKNNQGQYNLPSTKKIIDLVKAHYDGAKETANDDLELRLPLRAKNLKHKAPQKSANNTQLSPGQRESGKMSAEQPDFIMSVFSGPGLNERPVHRAVVRQSYVQYQQSYAFKTRYRPKTRSTNSQICELVDYMDQHPVMAIAKSTAGDTHCPYNAEWRRLAAQLNKVGTAKSAMAWKRTWRDLKKTAKKEPNKNRVNQRILEILDRAEKMSLDSSEMKVISVDALPFAADFDHVSAVQMSPGQPMSPGHQMSPERLNSEHSSPLPSDHENLQNNTSDGPRKLSRCTTAQKYALVDFMVDHLGLATSKYIETVQEDPYYPKWRQLSKYLNKIGNAKSTLAWKRTWRDLKLSILKKQWHNEPLLELDKKILEICNKDPHEINIRTVQGFDSLPCPTEGMPVLYLQESPEHHMTTPDIILDEECDEPQKPDQSNENEESPGRPSQEQMSPDQRDTASPGQRDQASPQSDGHETQKSTVPRKARRPRASPDQIDALVNYMCRHPSLATARCLYSPNERDPNYNEWARLCKYLNYIDRRIPPKSVSRWKCTWRMLTINARRKDRRRSRWNDRISRKIRHIFNEHEDVEDIDKSIEADTQQTEDYVFVPASEQTSLPDPLKCEEEEEFERETARLPKPRLVIPKKRSSFRQLRALADYMIAHPSLARKRLDIHSPAGVRIIRHLNKIGPPRSPQAWRQTWRDIKMRVRARAGTNEVSSCLEEHREKKIMEIMEAKSPAQPDDGEEVTLTTERKQPEPEVTNVTQTSHPVSPRSVIYNLAEILARNNSNSDRQVTERDRNYSSSHRQVNDRDRNYSSSHRQVDERDRNNKASTARSTGANETNDILREMLREVKISNDLKAEQNVYLRDILQQLRASACKHRNQNTEEKNTTSLCSDVQKEEVTDDDTTSNDDDEDMCSNKDAGES